MVCAEVCSGVEVQRCGGEELNGCGISQSFWCDCRVLIVAVLLQHAQCMLCDTLFVALRLNRLTANMAVFPMLIHVVVVSFNIQ